MSNLSTAQSNQASQALRERAKNRREGIGARSERIGKLNDEYMRLCALPELDVAGYLKLAADYEALGMHATACKVKREVAGRDIISK